MSDTPDSEGPAQAGGQFATEAEDRTMESRPRRVILRRDENGTYCIFMRDRMIQGFCNEFEDVTGYHIRMNRQQQVRICIESIGRQLRARYPERDEASQPILRARLAQEAQEEPLDHANAHEEPEVALFSSAHPQGIETWQMQARRGVQEQMSRLQDMLNLLESM